MVLRSIFVKVFQTAQCSRNLLNLIKDNQRIVGCDGSIGIYFQSHNDPFDVQVRRK